MRETFGSWDQRTQSLMLGDIDGIPVRVHVTFLLLAGFQLVQAAGRDLLVEQAVLLAVLFGLVLVHELGHCYAARAVGGHALEIVMWPFGGLAMTTVFSRPRECLITTLGGPSINLAIAVVLAPILFFMGWLTPMMFHPLAGFFTDESESVIVRLLVLVWRLNYMLLLLNILPIYPMDGGRAFQEVLWMKYGRRKSMDIATKVGIGGAILLAAFGMMYDQQWYMILGALFLFECWSTRQRERL